MGLTKGWNLDDTPSGFTEVAGNNPPDAGLCMGGYGMLPTGSYRLPPARPIRFPECSPAAGWPMMLPLIPGADLNGEYLVARCTAATGLGSGVVGLLVDGAGHSVGYRWSGGLYQDVVTQVQFGRID